MPFIVVFTVSSILSPVHLPNAVRATKPRIAFLADGAEYAVLVLWHRDRLDIFANIIKVICENNARPVLKKRMRCCACAKSRDLYKVA